MEVTDVITVLAQVSGVLFVLASMLAMRLAIVVAAQNFADDAEVITMVMVVGVIGLILFVAAGELGRRSSAAQAASLDNDRVRPIIERPGV